MKQNLNNLANKVEQAKWNFRNACIMTSMAMGTSIAHAGQDTSGAKNLVFAIIDTVVGIFPLIGLFFVVSGVFKLIMAYRNDQPEAQSAAAKDIVIGAVFIAFKVAIWVFGDQINALF